MRDRPSSFQKDHLIGANPMDAILDRRKEIYDHFHASIPCQAYFFDPKNEERYVAYYNSMYLIQDSAESLYRHRQLQFSADPFLAYLEFWGIMQATVIQQDAISELTLAITGAPVDAKSDRLEAWLRIRDLRNTCAGHSAKKGGGGATPIVRTFMGRNFGNYDLLTYERWEQGAGLSHPRISLGALLDAYVKEADQVLSKVSAALRKNWP